MSLTQILRQLLFQTLPPDHPAPMIGPTGNPTPMASVNLFKMDNLLGVIICGGESRRMGSDKGLLKTGEGHWATNMGDKLLSFKIPVFYSIHERQLEAYSSIIPLELLIPDSNDLPGLQGPLKGLLSVHEKFPASDLCLLACDMQDMDEHTIRQLLKSYWTEKVQHEKVTSRQKEDYQFFAYEEEEFLQPFCAIYTSEGLAAARQLAVAGDPIVDVLPGLSLQTLLRRGKTLRLLLANPAVFANYNSL